MPIDVDAALKGLQQMTVTQLRERYAEVWGEPTRSYNKPHLVKRIIWRLQAMQEGDLSERAKRRAKELANDLDIRIRPPPAVPVNDHGRPIEAAFQVAADARLPMAGTLIQREYKGRRIQVRVMPRGFEFEGEVYRSLSAIAGKVTGSHWNGYLFFGLPKPKKEVAQS